MERQVNVQIVFLFILLLALSIGSTVGSSIRQWFVSSGQWYLLEKNTLGGRGIHILLAQCILLILSLAKGFIEGWHNGHYVRVLAQVFMQISSRSSSSTIT